ncbi:MAG: hypothetical protein AAF270_01960 [Pseudomonadota bacterium]
MTASYENLIGYTLPVGSYRVALHESWLANDAMYAAQSDVTTLHPMFLYFAAIRGMGLTLEELFALFGASASDGPMLGETEISQERSMHVDTAYTVHGKIADVQRKHGARVATMDLVTVDFEIRLGDSEPVGRVGSVFVFRRQRS